MALTKTQRATINRANAARSTGPRTTQGRMISSRNAIKHGLCSQALTLPNENPYLAAHRSDAWYDHYRPASPGACHLLNQCVAASIFADRVNRYHAAVLTKQIEALEADYDRALGLQMKPLHDAVLKGPRPAYALRTLARTMAGCRWMIKQWFWYLRRLEDDGRTARKDRVEILRMMGYHPEASLKDNPEAWTVRLLVAICYYPNPARLLALLLHPSRQPDSLRATYRADALPDRATAARLLGALLTDQVERWIKLEDCLRIDDPDRSAASDGGLVIREPVSARLFLRYHAEARLSFQQNYRALLSTLESDAQHAQDEAEEADEGPAPDASRNEANDEENVTEPAVAQEVAREPRDPIPAPAAAERWWEGASEPVRAADRSVEAASTPVHPRK